MRPVCAVLIAVSALAQAPPPAEEQPKPLEERVKTLEQEVQRLKLQAAGEEEPPAPPPAPTPPLNVFNPTLTVIGNGLYRWDDRPVLTPDGDRLDKRFFLREVEVDMRAAVDPFADALAIVSFGTDAQGAEFGADVEEAYVTVKSLPVALLERPPLGLKLRVGRFLCEVGTVNRLHPHDQPWSFRPLADQEFWGDDGYHGDGASAQVFLPFFDEESALELTAQLVSGGGSRLTEKGTNSPGVVANLRWFRTFAAAHSFTLSGIFHEGATTSADAMRAYLVSGDGFYRWKPLRGGEFRSFVLGGQYDYAIVEDGDVRPHGWYGWAQLQPWRSIYVGGRYDRTTTRDDDAVIRQAGSGYVSWYTSEFLRLRGGYEHRWSDVAELDEDDRDSVFVEINFVFGSHPTEPFWVNK